MCLSLHRIHDPFTGNSGAILTIDVTAAQSFVNGSIMLHNNVLVEENGTRHRLADEIANVNGGTSVVIPGDVNGDGSVNSVDITALYNYLLNDDDSNIVNGDQDGDGRITAVDVTVLYNILLGD